MNADDHVSAAMDGGATEVGSARLNGRPWLRRRSTDGVWPGWDALVIELRIAIAAGDLLTVEGVPPSGATVNCGARAGALLSFCADAHGQLLSIAAA